MKYRYCKNCDKSYLPKGVSGLLYCPTCGATAAVILKEADSDSDNPPAGILIETPPVVEQTFIVEEVVPEVDTKKNSKT